MSLYDNVLNFHQNGFAELFWPQTEDKSRHQAEQSVKLLGAHSGHFLDWRGGWGRISMALVDLGFSVTLLDFCPKFIENAKVESIKRNINLRTILADSRETPSEIQADYAICAGNSVGFLEPNEEIKAFASLNKCLKPTAKVLVDCINLLYIAKELTKETDSTDAEGNIRKSIHSLDMRTNVNHSKFEILLKNGTILSEDFYQTLYTPKDLSDLLESAGFNVLNMFGSLNGDKLSADSRKIYLVAKCNN
jgi:hypothetical protein